MHLEQSSFLPIFFRKKNNLDKNVYSSLVNYCKIYLNNLFINIEIALIVLIVLLAVSIILQVIGLMGIIKQNKCILITLTVFSAIGTIGYLFVGKLLAALFSAIGLVLIGVYTYMVVKRTKAH